MELTNFDIDQLLSLRDQLSTLQHKSDNDCTPAELKMKTQLNEAENSKNKTTRVRVLSEAKQLAAELEELVAKQTDLKKEEEVQKLSEKKTQIKGITTEINKFVESSTSATELTELEKAQKKNKNAISALNKKGKDLGISEAIVPTKRGGGGKKVKKDEEGDVVMSEGDGDAESDEESGSDDDNNE
jgi:thymidylate synthase